MKSLAVSVLLLSAALTLAGCGTVPTSGQVPIGDISNLPQTLLNGASLENARAVAMGTARTKGWTITAADANRVLLERQLPATSPQAAALGSSITPPKVTVETDLVERPDGTVVALKAFLVSNPGTQEEQRIDYTAEYESQLLISLSALQSAWLDSRTKIASAVPVPSASDAAAQPDVRTERTAETDATASARPGASAPPVQAFAPAPSAALPTAPVYYTEPGMVAMADSVDAPTTPSAPDATASGAPVTAFGEPPPPGSSGVTAVSAPSASGGAAGPVGSGILGTTAPGLATAPTNDMLVLDNSRRQGLWAYYAEDYARLRGCKIGDRGAVLMQETPTYELHEVECTGSANILVKCQGGVCEGMR